MLTRIWERLPFSEGPPRRAYMDDAPLPFTPEPASAGTVETPVRNLPAPDAGVMTNEEALARMRAERDALARRLKRLEIMLADPEKGQNAILYYRLRALWDICHRDLMALSRQFHEKYAAGGAGEPAKEADIASNNALAAQLRTAKARLQALQEERKQIDFSLHRREKPFKVGEKQSLAQALARADRRIEASIREVKGLQARLAASPPVTETEQKPSAGKPALTVTTKRAINTTLIALAQHFYLNYREEQIAEMALRASRKSVDEVNFGLASECLALGTKVRELATRAKNEDNRHELVRKRVEYLKNRLRYASAMDAIPDQHALNSIPTRVGGKEGLFANLGEEVPVNVLALDYWNLKETLIS